MRNVEELKLSRVRNPPHTNDVREIEKLLGHQLPASYVQFLKTGNGGYPEVDTIDGPDGKRWAINNFFFVDSETDSTDSISWNCLNGSQLFVNSALLPIGRDAFGNIFLINLKTDSYGAVLVWVHDEPDSPLTKLCTSFDQFIQELKLNPDYI